MTALVALQSGCGGGEPIEVGLVLPPCSFIEAANENGSVFVESRGVLERQYRFEEAVFHRRLTPRRTPFRDRIGGYDPATSYGAGARMRLVLDESQLHFTSLDEADRWFKEGAAVFRWVMSRDGVVVGFFRMGEDAGYDVSVFQICIDGTPPTDALSQEFSNVGEGVVTNFAAVPADSWARCAPVKVDARY